MRALLISSHDSFDPFVLAELVDRGYETIKAIEPSDSRPVFRRLALIAVDFAAVTPLLTDLISATRKRHGETPLLVLLAQSTALERAAVLNAGADDCLSRPFAAIEMQARIAALERRTGGNLSRLGRLVWDWENHCGEVDSIPVVFSRTEAALLEVLLRSPNHVINMAALEKSIESNARSGSHNRLYVYVCRLRKKLKASGADIRSSSGVGYFITLDLTYRTNDHGGSAQ